MRLHSISGSNGSNRRPLVVGRGEGNGRGKTCGRGHKGQRARSGSHQRPGFESGHIPLYRRLPQRGFNNARFETKYAIVNLRDLGGLNTQDVTIDALKQGGLVRNSAVLVKILGDGEAPANLKVHAHKFSKGAQAAIEAAGGSVLVLAS